ncbi:MAG: hypothetical protein R2730_11995 [Chitinophagales bacterium]
MKKIIQPTILAISLMMVVSSCSKEEAIKLSPEQVTERIDMVIEGNDREYVYKQSQESDPTEDLITYNYYGLSANNIDFKINLSEDRTLTIQLTNKSLVSPWEHANTSYSIYPAQDEDDKVKFIRAKLETKSEGNISNYVSNYSNEFPLSPNLNAFTIVEYNLEKSEMLCRLNNITIVPENGNEDEAITITGTFRGSLSFL